MPPVLSLQQVLRDLLGSDVTMVTKLDLSKMQIDAAAMQILAPVLGQLTSLTSLNLSNNHLDVATIEIATSQLHHSQFPQQLLAPLESDSTDPESPDCVARMTAATSSMTHRQQPLRAVTTWPRMTLVPSLSRQWRLPMICSHLDIGRLLFKPR